MTQPNELKQLRQQIRQQRRLLSAEVQQQHAQQALYHLKSYLNHYLETPHTQASQLNQPLNIALFLAQDGELDTQVSIDYLWQSNRFRVFLPVLETKPNWHMGFAQYQTNSTMINNRFQIAEPEMPLEQHLEGQQIDIVLMPLVGFDSDGNRLGMGGGYYDRTFEFKRTQPSTQTEQTKQTLLIGWAHSCQQVDQLAAQPWDVPLDGIITEQGFTSFTSQ